MKKKMYLYDGMKSSMLWDEETDYWVYQYGKPSVNTPTAYYKIIPTLYRAIDKRAKAISTLPWAIYKGKTEYDTSADYENNTGLVDNMTSLLWLIEASLCLVGRSYLRVEKNPAGYGKVRYLEPTSITVNETKLKESGEIFFIRHANNKQYELTTDDIIYLWQSDPMVEIGPPMVSAAGTAIAACGVLANLDEFAREFFGRGAIKAMIFTMENAPKAEAEKLESWWNKNISGIRNAFKTKVFNAGKIEPVTVGEGIKELENITITKDKQEEIAIAMDIPMSLLFSNAANYATAQQDKVNWYTDLIIPEAGFISSVLNDQLYEPLGYHLEFDPESMSMFQEDEAERSAAMNQFITAVNNAGSYEMAQAMFDIFGVDISDEAKALIEKHYANKQVNAIAIQEQMKPKDEPTDEQPVTDDTQDGEIPPAKTIDLYKVSHELSIWSSKCLKALKRGDTADSVVFVTSEIPSDIYNVIIAGLKEADTADKVKDVFKSVSITQPPPIERVIMPDSGIFALAVELRRANDLLEINGQTASTA